MPSAASRGCSACARKSSTTSVSVKCPTCGRSVEASPRSTGASAAARACRCGSGSGAYSGSGPERLGPAALVEERLRGTDHLQRTPLALVAGVAPGGDAVPAEDDADRLRDWRHGTAAMSRPSWNPGRRHGTHTDPVAETLLGQRLPVGSGRQRDARVGMQMVDVFGVEQPVHRRVDRRRRAAATVQAVVEQGDHLVLAVDARDTRRPGRAAGPAAAPPDPPRSGCPDRRRNP